MPLHILGIRHHGVGSAQKVLEYLTALQPDLVLVEGPPELDAVMRWVGQEGLTPPAAVLGYNTEAPQQATFYPFAHFSPEWQAITYANQHNIPVRMLDLPLAYVFSRATAAAGLDHAANGEAAFLPARDPLYYLAELDGFTNSEAWWEYRFETGHAAASAAAHFEAVMLAMETLRDADIPSALDAENVYREAWMRDIIRQAQRELYSVIAVVCGAWHAPALRDPVATEKADRKLLKELPKPKIKVGVTWIPWTNTRLSMASGYGAGLVSPGWYAHRWHHPADPGEGWLTKVAHLFRAQRMDISTAHVIEAWRLADALAVLREKSAPGLSELNEATTTVMCMGDPLVLELVRRELIVGHDLGSVPDALPKVPLQADFEAQSRRLRLAPEAFSKDYALDLRKDFDLQRSILLHRLAVLGIRWGKQTAARGKGTFKETWELTWKPELLIDLIERAIWGNTVEDAAANFLTDQANRAESISAVATYIEQAIPAELLPTIDALLRRLRDLSAVSTDVLELMAALAPLARISRYGNVRNTDLDAIQKLVEGLVERICIGLPNAVYGMDERAAQDAFARMQTVDESLQMLENTALAAFWSQTLRAILNTEGAHPLLLGGSCRLLFDSRTMAEIEAELQFGKALSAGREPAFSAAWVEGFLRGSGLILLYDEALWNILYRWTADLPDEQFVELLPILRRTFAKFNPGERRQLGEKAQQGRQNTATKARQNADSAFFNPERAEKVLILVEQMLGIAKI